MHESMGVVKMHFDVRSRSPRIRRGSPFTCRWFSGKWLHVWAVLWIVLLAFAVLIPALIHGWILGTYDLLAKSGLTSRAGVVVHGSYTNTDLDVQMIPWTTLNWTQVHHGSLPLWNPYNGLGLPLAFNWQSSPFGLPSLIGYLFPLRYAYTAAVVSTLLIAGTGAYVLGRVLRFNFLGAVMVATIFELSGPLISWLGWPQAQVMAWGGWVFAAGILVARGRRRARAIAFFALTVALAIYAGHPEVLIVIMCAAGVFFVALLAFRALPSRLGFAPGPIRRPAIDLVVGAVAGCGLGAPLLLPALQLTGGSVRATSAYSSVLPAHDLLYSVFSSFDGVPVAGSYGWNGAYYYNETAIYVGIVAAVLALVAVAVAISRRRAEILAATAVAVVMGAVVYLSPVRAVAASIPKIGEIDWLRALMPLALVIAVLAGAGIDAVMRSGSNPLIRFTLTAGFALSAVLMAGLWLFGRSAGLLSFARSLEAHIRAESFLWPAVGVAVGLLGAAVLWREQRLTGLVACGLLAVETLFLLFAGSIQVASSPNGYPATHAVTSLKNAVGDATVGSGAAKLGYDCQLGISPEANILFQVHEFNLYDPIIPSRTYTNWEKETGFWGGDSAFDLFCPSFTTLDQARLYGVGYLLEPSGHPGPSGSQFIKVLKPANPYPRSDVLVRPPVSESLYKVPGSAPATITPLESSNTAKRPFGTGATPGAGTQAPGIGAREGFSERGFDYNIYGLSPDTSVQQAAEQIYDNNPEGGAQVIRQYNAVFNPSEVVIPNRPGLPVILLPSSFARRLPPATAIGNPVAVDHPNPRTWRLTVTSSTPQVLRLRLTDVPGWNASIDGCPLKLKRFSGVMLQAKIPSGNHVVTVDYWPPAFTIGLVVALLTFIGLAIALTVEQLTSRNETRLLASDERR